MFLNYFSHRHCIFEFVHPLFVNDGTRLCHKGWQCPIIINLIGSSFKNSEHFYCFFYYFVSKLFSGFFLFVKLKVLKSVK